MTEITGQCPAHRANTQGSDSYSFNTDKKVGSCLSCGLRTTIGAKGDLIGHYGDKRWFVIGEGSTGEYVERTPVKEGKEVKVDTSKGTFRECRGINERTMEFYGVRTTDKDQVYPYPSGAYKVRTFPKKFMGSGSYGGELFGQNLFPRGCSKIVTVTEGELDAMSAYQMLQSGSYTNPCVSVAGATPSKDFWDQHKKGSPYQYLDSFQKIILCVDQDEAGDKLAEKFREVFPDKVFRMNLGEYKDANEMLQAGDFKAFKDAWWGAKVYKPDWTLSDEDEYLKLYRESPDFEYFETGIPELDAKMLGICKGYITLIQAESGVGKTEFTRYLEWMCLTNSTYKIATCRKEETPLRSLLGMVSYDIKKNVTLKKLIEENNLNEEVEESIKKIGSEGRFITFKTDETAGNDETIKQLRYLIAAFDVDFILLDPVQDLVTGANASEKEGKISDLITRMGNLCGETGVGIIVIAHQNGDGGAMYSSMITKKAGFKIVLSGNREDEDLEERNKTYIHVKDKNRSGLGFGPAGCLTFDLDSYTQKPYFVQEPKVESKTVKNSKGKEEEIPF